MRESREYRLPLYFLGLGRNVWYLWFLIHLIDLLTHHRQTVSVPFSLQLQSSSQRSDTFVIQLNLPWLGLSASLSWYYRTLTYFPLVLLSPRSMRYARLNGASLSVSNPSGGYPLVTRTTKYVESPGQRATARAHTIAHSQCLVCTIMNDWRGQSWIKKLILNTKMQKHSLTEKQGLLSIFWHTHTHQAHIVILLFFNQNKLFLFFFATLNTCM